MSNQMNIQPKAHNVEDAKGFDDLFDGVLRELDRLRLAFQQETASYREFDLDRFPSHASGQAKIAEITLLRLSKAQERLDFPKPAFIRDKIQRILEAGDAFAETLGLPLEDK